MSLAFITLTPRRAAIASICLIAIGVSSALFFSGEAPPPQKTINFTKRSVQALTDKQWEGVTVAQTGMQTFRTVRMTEGKIAVDEDRSTPVYSPYAGRIRRLLVKPGDEVVAGQPLFVLEATDMVQAMQELMTASAAANKARSQLVLATTVEKRNYELVDAKAAPLKDWQQAQAALHAAQNDLRAAEVALEASRGRMRMLGRTDQEIAVFEKTGAIDPEVEIRAPIAGTVVQRKAGPGQYVGAGNSEPVFTIGDLTKVWLAAYVLETDAVVVAVGQPITFSILSYPGRTFEATVSYVAAGLDANTRRLLVRASVDNKEGLFRPEMFATIAITTAEYTGVAVPRNALIYDGESARVWVLGDGRSLEKRAIRTGSAFGDHVQIVEGLQVGEAVVVRGSLFVDRMGLGG